MLFMLGFLIFFFARVQLGDHDHGPLLDGLKRPSDYVLAGKNLFFQLCSATREKNPTVSFFLVEIKTYLLRATLYLSVIRSLKYHLNYVWKQFNDLHKIVSIRSSNDISLILSHISTIYGLIIDPPNNQLTVGLIAELVEPAPESLRSGFKSHSGLKIILEMGS